MAPEKGVDKRLHSADEVEITNNILDGLRAIDKDILGGTPMKVALEGACRSILEIFNLRLCWIGLVQEGSFEVSPAAWWGFEEGYLSAIRVTYDDSKYGRGPSGTAIKTRRPAIRNDIQGEANSHPWREEALKRGYRSSAAFPLLYNGNVVGALNAYSAEPNFFDRKQVKMIQAFADQVAILIRAVRNLEALRESEARYRGLVGAANDAVISADSGGKILIWNPAAERLFGYNEREALGQQITFIVPEKYRERALRAFQEVKRTGRLKRKSGRIIEAEGLRKDGATFPLEHSISIEDTASGIRFTTILRDITERKQTEEQISRLATAVKSTDNGVVILGLDGKILYANPAANRLHGYGEEELIGRPIEVLTNATPRQREEIWKAVTQEGIWRGELIGARRDGSGFQLYLTVSAITSDEGKPVGLVGIAEDITERKRAEEELRCFATVVKDSNDAIVVRDLDNKILAWNPAADRMYGYKKEEMIGRDFASIIPKEKKDEANSFLKRVLAGERLHYIEIQRLTKDGRILDVAVTASPLRDKDGHVVGLATTDRDITKRKLTEEALKESEKKFRDLTEKSLTGVYLIQNGIFKYANPKLAEIFGCRAEELIEKKGPKDFVLPEDWPMVEENIRRRISGEIESVHYEIGIRRKNGEVIHIEVCGSRTTYQGKPAIIGTLWDITEKKRAVDEIRRLKEFNEEIVQRMGEGVVVLDENVNIAFLNPMALSMLGYTKGELKGEPFSAICCCNKAEIQGHLERVREGHPSHFECTLCTKDGRELMVLNKAMPFIKGGMFAGYLITSTDITEWKATEEAFIERNLKYEVAKGNLYLSEEPEMKRAMDAFLDLLKAGYKGMVVTRRHPEEIREKYRLKEEVPVYWLGSEASPGASALPPELSIIEKEVRDFLRRKTVVLIDRLEYLASQKGFEETLALIQRLHELAYARKGVVLLSIDPAALQPHQLALLQSETMELERKAEPALLQNLREILEFVYQENREGRKPTHSDVSRRFGFSRVTRMTKLKQLKVMGLLTESRRGNFRALEVTEKGKENL